ncbi:membrane protein involved in aromatic hydrocarbon degradation [Thermocrinis albus DSM 14484]|uniref:Membrane protein involved in aromatic hydrocarbon degradation n=1 Tax=Thermocrinis albus (strain DSM 14484 / JCM 11386 / HI 11/12) TaxID=638303 RepID=D3SM47_THEAH|nr:outer membrane protein transport protein [Thermocrinis albus]ADC89827.1 membrane protein involved in aromatic hydrocarbon degradation [Thermocrinis albus DSM 14484]
MKKVLTLGALLFTAGVSFATNGDNLIGVSPASRGMGGIGVGMPVGPTDSIFRNPAWMSYYKGFNLSFGGILFMPTVKAKSNVTPLGPWNPPAEATSQAKFFVVPEVGIVHQINDRLTFGIGAFGVSGMGTDYRNKDPQFSNMHTTFQFMRVIPALAYKVNDAVAIAAGVDLAYGSLDMGAKMCDQSKPPNCWNAGGGQSQTYGIGFQLGLAYNMGDFLFAGITYQSPISMTYKRVFDSNNDGRFEDFKLTQPQELAFGVGIKPMQNLKVGMDVRWINWKNADGYKHFQWKDQWVIAIGGEYRPIPKLALRAGYNYGKSPIRGGAKDSSNFKNNIPNFDSPFSDFNIAYFNLVGFPAITEHHITLGLGYEFTKTFSVDLAYKHAFNKKVRATGANGLVVEGQNAQDAITVGLNWKF